MGRERGKSKLRNLTPLKPPRVRALTVLFPRVRLRLATLVKFLNLARKLKIREAAKDQKAAWDGGCMKISFYPIFPKVNAAIPLQKCPPPKKVPKPRSRLLESYYSTLSS